METSIYYPVESTITYFVEERLAKSPHEVHYVWQCTSAREAEQCLLELARKQGPSSFFSMYFEVEGRPS